MFIWVNDMSEVKIRPLDNGPFEIDGVAVITDGEGKMMKTENKLHLCRCGLSTNQPFCSGAHKGKFQNEVRK
jgi:CDGSH-type Zn-finger protein